jgi:hypothetical protein
VRKEMIMSKVTDPPSDERRKVGSGSRTCGFGRMLVTRQTLMLAFDAVKLAVRIAEILMRVFDGF